MTTSITAIQANITTLHVDAIVNAANSSLLGGGGLDGAIHRAAGSDLMHACRALHGCKTGEAKITDGYRLPARYIIHTVGPVWQDGNHQEAALLAQCYQRCMQIAAQQPITSIAFPCISTGIYRFPKQLAASIAVNTIRDYLPQAPAITQVIFCCFAEDDLTLYQSLLS